MALLRRRARREAEIPTAAMADVAFLLLTFFLVTTTMDADSGLYMELAPMPQEGVTPPQIADRNLLSVVVDASGGVAVEGERMALGQLRDAVKRHVLNEGREPTSAEGPELAVVSFRTDRGTRYRHYLAVLDEIKAAYRDVRDDYARQLAGVPYGVYRARLAHDAEDEVAEKYPIKIALAEPAAGP